VRLGEKPVSVKNAVLRFSSRKRGERLDAVAGVAALLAKGFRRTEMVRYHILQDGSGEECTWRYAHPSGETATIRIFYPNGE
jgi:hypothetical protein